MKLDIRRKILLLMGISGLITALLLGAILTLGLNTSYDTLDKQAITMAKGVSDEAVNYSQNLARKRLENIIRLKAYHINEIIGEMEGNLIILSNKISQISDSSIKNKSIIPKNPRTETVYSGEWYYLPGADDYSPQYAVDVANDLNATLHNLSKGETARPLFFYIGSKNGWSLRMDILPNDNDKVNLPQAALTRDYDARDRSWYKYVMQAEIKDAPLYVPLYSSAGGRAMLSVAMPYKDKEGIAGVLGVSIPSSTLSAAMEDNTRDKSDISFLLDSKGHVI
ncbi:MAG: cache domain-containing protein, partial [Anaerovibrio sp.]|nr:cache domain-containing protein [Anaerovibrio sp.]